MPLQFQNVEIILSQGLEQKTDAKSTAQGKLQVADNVEIDKRGNLNKRKGYLVPNVTVEATGNTVEETFQNVTTYRDELVIFAYDKLYALGSKSDSLPGSRALIERGKVPRMNITRQNVAVSRTGASN